MFLLARPKLGYCHVRLQITRREKQWKFKSNHFPISSAARVA
jgi:hypothetical protein